MSQTCRKTAAESSTMSRSKGLRGSRPSLRLATNTRYVRKPAQCMHAVMALFSHGPPCVCEAHTDAGDEKYAVEPQRPAPQADRTHSTQEREGRRARSILEPRASDHFHTQGQPNLRVQLLRKADLLQHEHAEHHDVEHGAAH